MQGEIVARSYAAALFELARKSGQEEAYGVALEEVATLLGDQPAFAEFIETPRIDKREKKRVLREAFAGRIPEHVLNFLLLVIDKRRQRLVTLMSRAYSDLLDESMDRVHVDVTVARPMEESLRRDVGVRLSRVLEKEVVPHVRVDPKLIGGIVVRSGDVVYDGSVRRRLEGLRRQLMKAGVSED